MTDKLKPCPFCGGEAEKPYATDVRCKNAECPAHYFVTWMPAKVWNTRPLEDALRAERDRAIQMVERLIESGKPIAKYLEHVDYRADTFIEIVAEWQARNE